jgi:hypothetical protein
VKGSKENARHLLSKIENFLLIELDLKLNKNKTFITNSSFEKASFLGVNFGKGKHRTYNRIHGFTARNKPSFIIEVPLISIKRKLREAGFLIGLIPYPKFI